MFDEQGYAVEIPCRTSSRENETYRGIFHFPYCWSYEDFLHKNRSINRSKSDFHRSIKKIDCTKDQEGIPIDRSRSDFHRSIAISIDRSQNQEGISIDRSIDQGVISIDRSKRSIAQKIKKGFPLIDQKGISIDRFHKKSRSDFNQSQIQGVISIDPKIKE
jgi:hypothetical protein